MSLEGMRSGAGCFLRISPQNSEVLSCSCLLGQGLNAKIPPVRAEQSKPSFSLC